MKLLITFFFSLTTAMGATMGPLNIGNAAEPKDLDPQIVTGGYEFNILYNLFEGLVQKDPKTLAPLPGVAESWKVSSDGKKYTFRLRKDAKWSNGEPVTAQDFVYSWKRLLDPKTGAEYAYQGYYFKNGKAFNEGKQKDSAQLGFKAVDERTLEVELEGPTPFFLSLLFLPPLYPVPQKAIEKFGLQWTRPGNLISNGAYELKTWDMNRVVTLEKSPNYWDKKNVRIDRVNFYPTVNDKTEEMMFRTGKLHITNTVPLEKTQLWKREKNVYQQFPYLAISYYEFNVTKPPFDNKLVRRALALAIDREKLVKYVTKGGEIPATAFTPPGAGGYRPDVQLPKDGSQIKLAEKLLAQAGYPGGKGFPKTEVLYNTDAANKKVAEAIQEMWRTNLGIEVGIYNQEWKVFLDTQHTKNYQVSRARWIADYNDPKTFLDLYVTDGGNNDTGWSNKTYDSLIDATITERDLKKRLELFRLAEKILMDELPVVPLYVYTKVYLKSPSVQGWYNNVEDIHPVKFVSLAE